MNDRLIDIMKLLVFLITLCSISVAVAREEIFIGEKGAPITLVEYGSLTCDSCIYFHRAVLPSIQADYIDKARVRYSYRHFPTGQAALEGAIATQCAGDQYYQLLDRLYLDLEDWYEADNQHQLFIEYAKPLGVDVASYKRCLNEGQAKAQILRRQQEASEKYGIIGTPTFLINGQIVKGKKTFAEMKAILNGIESGATIQH
jgi:protein-disulfide isomerase